MLREIANVCIEILELMIGMGCPKERAEKLFIEIMKSDAVRATFIRLTREYITRI